MELIDKNAFIQKEQKIYCDACSKRRGLVKGKEKCIYSIGDAPCRACYIDIVLDDLDNEEPVNATEVVRCKNCMLATKDYVSGCLRECRLDVLSPRLVRDEHFCSWARGERNEID